MECPVCYERVTNCKLVCGHQFCKTCVKTWYLKGENASCPMCRKKVHYRRMPVKKWKAEAEESKKDTIFEESFDELIDQMMEPVKFTKTDDKKIPQVEGFVVSVSGDVITYHRTGVPTHELEDLQKTYRAIKDDVNPDELDFILNETDEYVSDRRTHLNKRSYSESGHWYGFPKKTFKNKPRMY